MNASSRWTWLEGHWARLAPKEKWGIQVAVAIVLVALVWAGVLGPGLQQWRTADTKAKALEAQLEQMRALQSQAQALQTQPVLGYEEAVRAFKLASTDTLGGTAQVSIMSDRALVTLQNAKPQALGLWLTQARLNARSVPLEAKLTRGPNPGPLLWNGTLTMSLPAK